MPTPDSHRAGKRPFMMIPDMRATFGSCSTVSIRVRGGWNVSLRGDAGPWGFPYGDQGLLIHRDLLRDVGGMRPLPLMEDVDLVRRLGRGRLVALPADAVTSAAKWESQGYLRRSARNLACLTLWFAGLPPRHIQRLYQ